MNPKKFSEIINDLPDEFIVSAADPQYGKESPSGAFSGAHPNPEQTASGAAHEAIRQNIKRMDAVPEKPHSDFSAPRWITAAATAACLVFAVGFGAVIMFGGSDHLSTYSTEDTQDMTAEVVTAVSDETAVTTVSGTITRTTIVTQYSTMHAAPDSARQTDPETRTTTIPHRDTEVPAKAGENPADTAVSQTNPQTTAAASAEPAANTEAEIVTTTAEPVILPEIVKQHCQTLEDGVPLWISERDISFHDGSDYTVLVSANGERVPNDEPFTVPGMYAEIGCAMGAPGETVRVPVYIAGVPELTSMIMFIETPDGLELTEIATSLRADFGLHFSSDDEIPSESNDGELSLYLPRGSMVLAVREQIQPPDGYVLAYYSYQIPEDAQPGTVYPVRMDTTRSVFGIAYGQNYQYTLLNGVVAVEAPE